MSDSVWPQRWQPTRGWQTMARGPIQQATWFYQVLLEYRHAEWRRQWHPTPVLLLGKSHGQRSLVGCSPWGHKESDMNSLSLSLFTFMHWKRKWQPTPVLLPGESQGRGSLLLPSMGSHRVGHDWSDLAAAAAAAMLSEVTILGVVSHCELKESVAF